MFKILFAKLQQIILRITVWKKDLKNALYHLNFSKINYNLPIRLINYGQFWGFDDVTKLKCAIISKPALCTLYSMFTELWNYLLGRLRVNLYCSVWRQSVQCVCWLREIKRERGSLRYLYDSLLAADMTNRCQQLLQFFLLSSIDTNKTHF